jgi:hypothetical protein
MWIRVLVGGIQIKLPFIYGAGNKQVDKKDEMRYIK